MPRVCNSLVESLATGLRDGEVPKPERCRTLLLIIRQESTPDRNIWSGRRGSAKGRLLLGVSILFAGSCEEEHSHAP